VRAEQRLERIERVGGSRGGRDGARGDESSDRGSGLQASKIVHGTSPIDAHWSNGGAPGFKMLAEINLTAWLPAAPESVSQLISLGFLRLPQCGERGSAATPATGRKTPQRRHDTSAGPARYGRAACQPTTASATPSVEAKEGLMRSSGVLPRQSRPTTESLVPSTRRSRATLIAIGLGRAGDRSANVPRPTP